MVLNHTMAPVLMYPQCSVLYCEMLMTLESGPLLCACTCAHTQHAMYLTHIITSLSRMALIRVDQPLQEAVTNNKSLITASVL